MSSEKQNEGKMNRDYWDDFSKGSSEFITAKQITSYIVVIAITVQIIGAFITPSNWLIWNALTFIMATNLGAVILAIKAQDSADKIRTMYQEAFDADFYHTLHLMTTMKKSIEKEAMKEGISLTEEMDNLGADAYSVVRGYMKSFAEHYHISQNQDDTDGLIEAPEYADESELFSDQ